MLVDKYHCLELSQEHVRRWLRGILVDEAGFGDSEAQLAAEAACSSPRGSFNLIGAITAATGVRAMSRVPGGKAWWSTDGKWAKEHLIAGKVDEAVYRIAEMVAEPAPDDWDPNWPEHKAFALISVPDGAAIGDEFVVGNGGGSRGRFRVEQRDGRLGAALINSSWSLGELFEEASANAEFQLAT